MEHEKEFDFTSLVSQFNYFIKKLEEFRNEHEHLNIKLNYVSPNGYKLGYYVVLYRNNYSKKFPYYPGGKTILDHTEGWSWNLKKDSWENLQIELKKYFDEYGNSDIPAKYEIDGLQLGRLVNRIRSRGTYINEFDEDRDERLEFLKTINFTFYKKEEMIENSYQEFLEYFKKYISDFESNDISCHYVCEDGYELGSRINGIRNSELYIKNNPKRKKELEELNFIFDSYNDVAWFKFIKELEKFYQKHNHIKILGDYITDDGYRLGQTLSTVRNKGVYINNYPERKKKLDEMGIIWSPYDKLWEQFIKYLKLYLKQNNNSLNKLKKSTTIDNYNLGSIAHGIVYNENFIKNNSERKEILKKLGFNINPTNRFDVAWENFVYHLKLYLKENDNSVEKITGSTTINNYNLGSNIQKIKSKQQYIKMDPSRKQFLIDLGLKLS